MGAERAFDLERRDIDAADLEHVVAAAAVHVIAVLVLQVLVARARPFAEKSLARPLAVVPIHDRAGRAAHLQLAHFTFARDHVAVVVHEADVVARHRLAGRAVFHVAGIVGKKDVEHFGRADAVEHVEPITLLPASANVGRQGLTRGHAASQVQIRAPGRGWIGEEGGVEGRHRIKGRYRVLAQNRGNPLGRRTVGREYRCRAGRHRKCQRVAEPISEKQLCYRVADVAFVEAEHAAAIEIGGKAQTGVYVHCALGPAGRARGVEPKAHVVARGRRGIRFALSTREQVFETAMPAPVFARDDDVHQIRARPDQVGEFR